MIDRSANIESVEKAVTKRPCSRRRKWLLRGMAIGLGLLLLLLVEGICRIFGWGTPTVRDDPFVGFSSIQPLFELAVDGTRYQIAPARDKFFADDSFPAQKEAGTFRVFCLGGSTVQGRPFSIQTSFPTFLKLALDTAAPQRNWEVINCGGVSYASYRLVPILEECLAFEPDLIVLCTGHNEFLEARSYEHLKSPSLVTRTTMNVVARSRLFWAIRNQFTADVEPSSEKPILPTEVQAVLDYEHGLKQYHRDDALRDRIVAHYEVNLLRMLSLAKNAHVPVILIRPPSNLADSPPFKSEHSSLLSDERQVLFGELMSAAQQTYRTDLDASVKRLDEALELDDRFALAWYELGQCLLGSGRTIDARAAFLRAREEDVCPLRMIAPLEEALMNVAEDGNVPLLDAFALLEAECDSGILDDEILVDHVHPSFVGHQRIAEELLEQMQLLGLVEPASDWKSAARLRFREQIQNLDTLYFHNGRETLKALQGWAAGRSTAVQPTQETPRE